MFARHCRECVSQYIPDIPNTPNTPLPPPPSNHPGHHPSLPGRYRTRISLRPASERQATPGSCPSQVSSSIRELTTPAAFNALAESTLVRAQLLTERILRANQSRCELFKVVKNLDRLSDLLAPTTATEKLCEYMNVLNTHILRTVLHDPEVVQSLSQEALQTALIFWRDFEKSAIKLPPEQRKQFVSLSSEILTLGHEFVTQASAPRSPAIIEPSELEGLKDEGMGARLRRQAWSTQRSLLVYPGSHQAYMIMTSAPNESPRQKLYMAAHTSSQRQIECLERLLHARAELARLVGWDSYAGMTLNDKMAKTPENVRQFLDTSLERTTIYARNALHTLRLRKQSHLNTQTLPIIQAWDRSFYCPPEPPEPPIPLPSLSLGRVFMGLSRLFKHLYGISLRPVQVASGEVWHSDVHKLEVVDENAGVIGWIYADLFARNGKSCGAAHYTVRCSRRTDDDDENGDLTVGGTEEFIIPSRSFEAIKRQKLRGMHGEYQLPLVVLLTLFHEMGHAMHSMIGRTEYHNVAGTRCATDFVELPSILMEYFLNSPKVLSLFEAGGSSILSQTGNHHEDPLGTSFQTQFGHLYGYGATYYSYLFDRAIASHVWRNVFSAEPLNRDLGEKYKAEILRYGGGKDPWEMLGALLDAPHLQVGDKEAMREVGRWRVEDGPISERH
ncbi:mitochondrial intermediate peptidase [Chiua virens]|nr:mitochondrial intermediate peptidase [Chiua virens]